MKIMKKKSNEVERSYKDLLLLIDGSNLSHRAYQKFKNMKGPYGEGTGLIFGFFKVLRSYIEKYRPTHVVVCFDTHASKQSNFRNALTEGYKGHRVNLGMDYEDFNKQTEEVVKMLTSLNVDVVIDYKGLGYEADDYVAKCAKMFTKGGNNKKKVIIISSDKDFCQLINKNIKVYNPFRDTIINRFNCKNYMNYTPDECVDYLSLIGDKSDDIKGYSGIGEVKARAFLDEFGSIKGFLRKRDAVFKGIDRVALRVLYRRNKKLIDLDRSSFLIDKVPYIKGKNYPDNFKNKALVHGIRSIVTDEFMETFNMITPWKGLKNKQI